MFGRGKKQLNHVARSYSDVARSGKGANNLPSQSYSEVAQSIPPPTPRTTTAATRTITLQPKDYRNAGRISNLLNNLEELQIDLSIEGARSIGTAFFEVTANTMASYKEVKRRFEKSENSLYNVIDKANDEPFFLTIDGLHAEYPTVAITEYLHKYFIEPTVQRECHNCTRILNGKATVKHKGLKMPLKPFLYEGPNMTVKVVGQTLMPLEDFKMRCARCLEDGHMIYSCQN